MTGHAEGLPACRYTAELAGEIEARWQRRWAERGTFAVIVYSVCRSRHATLGGEQDAPQREGR